MLVEISLGALIIVVALLVTLDGFRTKSEAPHGYADRPAQDLGPIIGHARAGRMEEFLPPPAATGTPAAPRDAGPARRPDIVSPGATGSQPVRTAPAAARQTGRRELKNWRVSTRLLLLVAIPTVAVAVVAFCVVRMVGAVGGASIHSPDGSVRDGAVASAIGFGVAAVIILALAAWSAIVAARSVLRPLGRLRAGALELPDTVRRIGASNGQDGPPPVKPVDVDSSDELGEVARAFDQMRSETLRMAANEAVVRGRLNTMFTNLSQRSQSLVERQIRLIDSLEQGEQDAGRLASLSKMDRIAARMHRGSQNLLVLAGREVSDRWNQPVALASVISAAVSEIEDDERVSFGGAPDIAVRGPAVNDLVHLLAELTENATSFSAGDMRVDVSSRLLTTGGVLIEITDRGIGMMPKEMAYANWQLENVQAEDVVIPHWIGLFVVARLAARHGIRVRLRPAEFGGLTALVWLPDDLLTRKGAAASQSLSDAATAGPAPGTAGPPTQTAVDPRYAAAGGGAATVTAAGYGAAAPSGLGPARVEAEVPALATQAARTVAGATAGQAQLSVPGSPELSEPEASPLFSAAPGAAATASQAAGTTRSDVIMPPAEGHASTGPLPIFEEMESRWFGAGRLVSGRKAAGSRWSSPADEGWRAAQTADVPASAGSTTAGLPRRMPAANLLPGAIPSTQPSAAPERSAAEARARLAGFQRGISEGRAAASEAPNQNGED